MGAPFWLRLVRRSTPGHSCLALARCGLWTACFLNAINAIKGLQGSVASHVVPYVRGVMYFSPMSATTCMPWVCRSRANVGTPMYLSPVV